MKLFSQLAQFAIASLLCVSVVALFGDPVANNPSANGVFNIRDFGVKGDGVTLDTQAINSAIDAASAAGGGTVIFPPGNYLSASIHLKSDITLDLESGATIIAAPTGYDPAEDNPAAGNYEDFGHAHWHNSLIWGDGLHDIAIIGRGRIFGQGLARDFKGDQTGIGNKSIALKLCRNVLIRDITIQHGGWFGILATGVDNFSIDNLKIDTNRDGMDIDCCRNVHVSNCSVNSPRDDGICLKSSYGLGFKRATENVTITNCIVSGFDEGTLLDGTFTRTSKGGTGRIKLGTESNGGFKNITISNCVFDNCCGLALEEVDGGNLEDVSISNITMRDIVNSPIFLRLGGRLRGPAGTAMGTFQRVDISHVTVYNADPKSSILITGVPDGIVQDVSMEYLRIYYQGGGTRDQAAIVPPEDETGYPEPGRFGVMPAYGIYARHVQNLNLNNIILSYQNPDQRPAMSLNSASEVLLEHVTADHAGNVPVIVTTDVKDLKTEDVSGMRDQSGR